AAGDNLPPSVTLTGQGVNQWYFVSSTEVPLFPPAPKGSSSAPFSLTITNQDTIPHQLQPIRLGGPNPTDFVIVSDDCSNRILNAGQACGLSFTFSPTGTGLRSGLLQIVDSRGSSSNLTIAGTGQGPVAQLSTSALTFEDGTIGATQTHELTLTNTGQGDLQVQSVEVNG